MTFALSLTCVSAVDFNNESVTDLSGFNDDNAVGEFSTQTNGIYSDVSDGTFTDLQSEINNAPEGSVLKLNRNYCGSEGAVVNLNKNLTIDGQGHTIDCLEDDCQAFYSSSGTITLKNLKITNSYGSDLSSLHYGAIYITGSAKYTIENCVFEHNIVHDEHGGAICHHGEQLNITNCQFINNRGEHGGAIFIAGSSRYTIENCVFKDNYAFVFG